MIENKGGYTAEGAGLRKHIHTKAELVCAKCGAAYDPCVVLEHRLKDCGDSEWRYVTIATKEVNCRKCGNDTFKLFEIIDRRLD
jgi:ribosomal protein L37E